MEILENPVKTSIKLTEFSHGAGCGCKISPALLEDILHSKLPRQTFPQLLVGYDTKDDAAVYDTGNGEAIISTTDFFMPIVDDPFEFGQIAATNAISDIYAMGGSPMMAISIFGWPIDKLDSATAQRVIEGGRQACRDAGIPLAGGHSIDAPEPIFGLAVTGRVKTENIKRNSQAQLGDCLFLTKPLGIGILTTAEKKKLLREEHKRIAPETMIRLNKVGAEFSQYPEIHAMTDVTGFGLMGHLLEICEASKLGASLNFASIPTLPHVDYYLSLGCSPGGAQRNFESYGHKLGAMTEQQKKLLCDPQTSGGLLVCVSPQWQAQFIELASRHGLELSPLGQLVNREDESQPVISLN